MTLLLRHGLNSGGIRILLRKDRKSTRLNSSHSQISYADFCLKKKDTADRRGGELAEDFGQLFRRQRDRPLCAPVPWHHRAVGAVQGCPLQPRSLYGGLAQCGL